MSRSELEVEEEKKVEVKSPSYVKQVQLSDEELHEYQESLARIRLRYLLTSFESNTHTTQATEFLRYGSRQVKIKLCNRMATEDEGMFYFGVLFFENSKDRHLTV